MTVALIILALAACACAATMAGGLMALKLADKLPLVMGFSAGAVIGVAFFDLAPEALDAGAGLYQPRTLLAVAALGFFLYTVLDRLVARHDCEGQANPARGLIGAASFSAHSLLDGFAMGIAFQASREITQYLIGLGHTRCGFIQGHPNQTASARRFEGFRAALDEAGIGLEPGWIQPGEFTYRSGLKAAEKLLGKRQRPSAIVASNDDMAAAVVSVAHRRGLDVPRDLSVVGFDDTSAATNVWPELTTVRQPIASMADTAVDILMRAIRRQDGTVVDKVLAHTLVKRGSVAVPGVGG